MGKVSEKSTQTGKMPERIFAQASPRSIGGVSIFDAFGGINANTVANFQSEQRIINNAVSLLRQAGFEILNVTPFTINIAGSQKNYETAFNTELITEERPVIKEGAREDTATFIDCPKTELPGLISTAKTKFSEVLEGIAIEVPVYFMAESAYAPLKSYWHLRIPGDVSLGVNADKVHRSGITGKGIKIAMVDSGHYKHPFFVKRGYRVAPVVLGPGAANPLKDESGHGTGESANIFSVAPDINLLPVKINFANSVGAFNAAVALQPDIITCSWGSDRKTGLTSADQVLATAVAAAWAAGIIVVFSAGNGHYGFPGQHPDVISAGGVFMDSDESLRASDYASGFMSEIYQNRRVPDLCGLVGMRPKAIYIMLPVEPGDSIDSTPWNHPSGGGLQGGTHPDGDETAADDGWAAFSGTSAAAPQLAGVAALIKQACSKLSNNSVRDIMMKTARDVTQGTCNPRQGNQATQGPDLATGYGLVDAYKAVMLAKVRCLSIRGPIVRGPEPITREPVTREPITREPITREPITREPITREPITREPIRRPSPEPIRPDYMYQDLGTSSQSTMSQEDIESLEDMVINSGFDLGDVE